MKRNIFIFGEPRSGKSTLANMIVDKFGYHIIRSDCERNALKENFPKLNINSKTALSNKDFQLYLKQLVFQYQRDGRNQYGIVLEGTDTSVTDCNELFHDGDNIIYYLGPIAITPEELAKSIKQNDTDLDWTHNCSMEELIERSKGYIERAKRYKKQCELYGINFVDTSKNREQVLQQIIQEIEPQISNTDFYN